MFFKKYSICKLANYFAVLLYSTHNLQYMHEYVCSFSLNGNIKKPTTNEIPTIGFSTFYCWKCSFRKLSLGFKSHAQVDFALFAILEIEKVALDILSYKDDSKTFVVLAQKGTSFAQNFEKLKVNDSKDV